MKKYLILFIFWLSKQYYKENISNFRRNNSCRINFRMLCLSRGFPKICLVEVKICHICEKYDFSLFLNISNKKTMTKKQSKKVVENKKEVLQSELQKLAHSGTKDAIKKIEKYTKEEKDPGKRAYAEMALEECEMFYYQPTNEKEEKDFDLCKLIRKKEESVEDKKLEIEKLKSILEKSELEGRVHKKVLENNKKKKEDWQYNWMPDFVAWERGELEKIKNDIAYDEAWVKEAKKMIKTERYKNIPARYLDRFDIDFEEDFFEDPCDCEDKYFHEPPF